MKELTLEIEAWIIEQALTLSAQVNPAENIDGRAAAGLVRAIVDADRMPVSDIEVSSCKLLALAWCDELHGSDEWDEVFSFSRRLDEVASMSWTKSEAEQIDKAFEHWLDAELEAILDNAKDLDEAESWVSDVHRVTQQYFGMSDYSVRFSQFDANVEEKFGNGTPEGQVGYPYPPFYEMFDRGRSGAIASAQSSSPTAGLLERLQASAAASKSARDNEAAQIQAMFEHLR